jgi:hypothetical protein
MCYIGPTTAAIVTTFIWQSKRTSSMFWLMLMFYGAALFGVIDHLWNGELLLVSQNWLKDALLGAVITAGVIAVWKTILYLDRRNPVIFPSLESHQS